MKILFTGSSSFTGYWFIQSLIARGHEVVATFRQKAHAYQGRRAWRVQTLLQKCATRFEAPLGSLAFEEVLEEGEWDVFCHHAAEVTHYRSPDFEVLKAVGNNCASLPTLMQKLQKGGCQRVLLTGSVFEPREGLGERSEEALSAYGLSKGMTADFFRYYARAFGLHLGKFVIPNPFGPWEEERFTSYLARCWLEGKEAFVATPRYIRDNIHVSYLAAAYSCFVESLPSTSGASLRTPSGYVESQAAFTARCARELGNRLALPCAFKVADEQILQEPLIRVNRGVVDPDLAWEEEKAWDELAEFYAGPGCK